MLNVAFALTHIFSEEQTVTDLPARSPGSARLPAGTTDVTYGSLLTVVLFLAFAYALGNTAWGGQHVYASATAPRAPASTASASPG